MVYYVALLNYQTAYEYGRKASMTLRHLRNEDSFLNIVIDYIDAHYDLKKGGKEHFLKVFFGIYASFTLEMNAIESPGVYKRIERDFQAFIEDLNETLRSAHASRKLALNLSKKSSKKSSVTTLLDKAFNQKEEKALRELNWKTKFDLNQTMADIKKVL
jgi:hypothetical protein